MTSISAISSNNGVQQFSQVSQRGMQPPPPPDGDRQGKDSGGLLGAIDSALKSAGIEGGLEAIFGQSSATSATSDSTSTDSSSTDTSATTDPTSSLNAFLQQLMSALQAQGTSDSDSAASEDSEFSMQGVPPPPSHGYGGQGIEDKLQSLISSLTSASSESTSTDSNSDSSSLESSFQSLVSSLGGKSDNSSFSNFLQSLATSMQHHGPTGNVVSTTA